MTRRITLRRSLVAAAAPAQTAAAAVPAAHAGGVPRASQCCPLELENWTGVELGDVTITRHFGTNSETSRLGDVRPGWAAEGDAIHFYSGGAVEAGDCWSITGSYRSEGGSRFTFWRSLDRFDLHALEAGATVTIDMMYGIGGRGERGIAAEIRPGRAPLPGPPARTFGA